jgi:hypothetical protein
MVGNPKNDVLCLTFYLTGRMYRYGTTTAGIEEKSSTINTGHHEHTDSKLPLDFIYFLYIYFMVLYL